MIYGQYENPNIEKMLSKGNHYASMRNQVSISMNMIVSMGACYGIAYYVGMQMGKESSTVSFELSIKLIESLFTKL